MSESTDMLLSRPVTEWPLILCGPILRRVDASSVSVFVALRFRRRITLKIFACDTQGAPATSLGQSAPMETRRLGQRLHVAVITAYGLSLQPLQLCGYDLEFARVTSDPEDDGPALASLQSLGLLGGADALGYLDGTLPTFRVLTDRANALEFIHASCRKLHGEGTDAFPHIDELIKGLRLHEFKRPQMMFLTGDQIYADDVAGPLSPVLTEVGNLLLGWTQEEVIPTDYGNAPISTCWPGLRNLVVNQAGFKAKTEPSACHLLGLGEYYAMYLIAWSDAVWPASFPDPAMIYPDDVFKQGGGNHNPFDSVPSSSVYGAILGHARAFIGNGATWREQAAELLRIKKTLPAVRRLMANVPIFMMFDDHEVTDDWNFDRGWHQRVYESALGRRIIGNALSAYAVFQAWGNDPLGEFEPTQPGGQLVSALEDIGALDGTTYTDGNPAYERAHTLMRVAPQSTPDGVTWDYGFERGNYRLIVLDTRTRRGITHEGQADLMPPSELDRQITARARTTKAVTLVLSPAPVIGHPFHERVIGVYGGNIDPKYIDKESWWNEDRPEAFEGILDHLSQAQRVIILSGDVHYGFTSTMRYWNQRPGREAQAAIVQLCSSALKNEDGNTRTLGAAATEAQRDMLQAGGAGAGLVLGGGTPLGVVAGGLAGNALADAVIPPEREDYVGWSAGPVTLTRADGKTRKVLTKPPVCLLEKGVVQTADRIPEWRYRLGFACDLINGRGGIAIPPAQKPPVNEEFLALKQRLAQELRVTSNNNSDLIVVGRNNFGTVTVLGEPPHLAAMHKLWFRPRGQPILPILPILPYTTHFASLDIPDGSESLPLSATPPAAGLPDLSAWADVMSFRPTPALQDKVRQLDLQSPGKWFFHRLESGWGEINLDYYAVCIDKMPRSLPGDSAGTSRIVTPEELCQYVRHNMVTPSTVVNEEHASFRPYGPSDGTAWKGTSTDALGALISIDMQLAPLPVPVEDGTVMVTHSDDTSWTFSTVHSPNDGSHPVSGNRRFGVLLADDGNTYVYTLGADRVTNQAIGQTPGAQLVWLGADKLWRSFQERISELVNTHGGSAKVLAPNSRRYDWSSVMSAYYSPKSDWQR